MPGLYHCLLCWNRVSLVLESTAAGEKKQLIDPPPCLPVPLRCVPRSHFPRIEFPGIGMHRPAPSISGIGCPRSRRRANGIPCRSRYRRSCASPTRDKRATRPPSCQSEHHTISHQIPQRGSFTISGRYCACQWACQSTKNGFIPSTDS